ncbi:TPA: ester cyclase [Vibrio vulnificus]|nr:ester cyclase [Vibrio vulnificus]HAT7737419.1 ester cyclase [Vibrio vulnificus]
MKKILLASALTLMGGNVMSNELAPEIFVNDGSALVNSIKDAAMNYAKFWNTGDEAYAREALAMDFIDKTPPEGRRAGIEGVLEASANFRKAVPDLHVTVEHLLITGEFATIRYRFKGHFSGVMGEVKGANQTIDFPAVDIYQIQQGKIINNWHMEDYATFFAQAGIK